MRTFGRILLYIAIAIVALPLIYIIGVYAVVLGAYAVVALGAVIVAPFVMWPPTLEDFGVWVLYLALSLIVLALCVGGLRLIWHGTTHFISSIRNRG